MIFKEEKSWFNVNQFSFFYFIFVFILVLFVTFYFIDSKPSTTAFVTYTSADCKSVICSSGNLDSCVILIDNLPLCQYCFLKGGCPPEAVVSPIIREPSSNEIILPENLNSRSLTSQAASAREYAQYITNRILSTNDISNLRTTTPSLSISPHSTPRKAIFSVCQGRSNEIECTQKVSILLYNKLNAVEDLIDSRLKDSHILLKRYPKNLQIVSENLAIKLTSEQFQNSYSPLMTQLLAIDVAIKIENEQAEQENLIKIKKERMFNYYEEIRPVIPVSPSLDELTYNFVSKPFQIVDKKKDNCYAPVQNMIYEDIGEGVSGVDYQGKECSEEPISLIPYLPVISGGRPTNLPQLPSSNSQSSSQNLPTNFGFGSSGNSAGVFLISPSSLEQNNLQAVVIAKGTDELIKLGLLLAPTHADLEKKITDFVNSLFFDTSETSSQVNIDSFTKYSPQIPWFLWSTLGILLISFLILGKILLLDEKYIISQGKKDLIKKDFDSAVKRYNSLLSLYDSFNNEENNSLKNSILEYKIVLINSLKNSSIHYTFNNSSGLSNMVLDNLEKTFTSLSHEMRVEKLINDAKKEKNRKLAVSRLSVISELYRKLDSSAQKRLAEKYEDLIYSLR